jgi:hypothetical protein
MKTIFQIILLAACLAFSGCIGLQHMNAIVHYGVNGRLLDADTQNPITNTAVNISVDGRNRDLKTNRDGYFAVPPETNGYWTWLGGPIYKNAEEAKCEIRVSEYATFKTTFVTHEAGISTNGTIEPVQKYCLQLGNIKLKKPEPHYN